MVIFKWLIFLLPILGFSQLRDSIRVNTPIYEAIYSEVLESPRWVQYKVLCTDGKASRKGMDFYTNDSIHTSDNKDYVDNHYDKGHMAPAADFNCTHEMLLLTFSYINCALQDQYLNRGVWRILEAQEREWAKAEPILVTIVIKFARVPKKLPTGAAIPVGFSKTIEFTKSKKKLQYFFPNLKPSSSKPSDYLIK